MFLTAGQRLGPYEILAPIGAGGMGEVYRGRDTRLQRTVAIKVLPPKHAGRSTRLQRFEMEGRAISALSHPNICSLFDVGESSGLRFLVMEYLEGETLHARLKRGRLPMSDALALAIQIGSALDHAHRRGLIHRDLNPSNIMLLKANAGQAKLLDFGLVKMMEPASQEAVAGATMESTETRNLTAEGTIVGTFQYMAPEQLEGKEATPRTDIFAFGCVLYEMATGAKAFAGESRVSLISAIMKDEPSPVTVSEPAAPASLDRVIRKCLTKDPEDRWQSVRDLVDELKWIAQSGSDLIVPTRPLARRSIHWSGWALAAVLATVAAALALRPREAPSRAQLRFDVLLPDKLAFRDLNYPVVSPDGARVVLAAGTAGGKGELLIRRLDSTEIQHLPATEDASYPFWSPDSRSIAFFAGGKLKRVELTGGSPVTLADAPGGIGGAWNRDGVIVFCPKLDSSLERVNDSGGVAVPTSKLDAQRHQTSQLFPDFLPDGHHFLFYGISAGREDEFNAAYIGSIDSLEVRPLFRSKGRIEYASPGYVLFPHGDSLMAQTFDSRALRVVGEPTLVVERMKDLGAVLGSAFSESDGALAYISGTSA